MPGVAEWGLAQAMVSRWSQCVHFSSHLVFGRLHVGPFSSIHLVHYNFLVFITEFMGVTSTFGQKQPCVLPTKHLLPLIMLQGVPAWDPSATTHVLDMITSGHQTSLKCMYIKHRHGQEQKCHLVLKTVLPVSVNPSIRGYCHVFS